MKRARVFMSVVVASSLIFGLSSHLFAESESLSTNSQLISQQENNKDQNSLEGNEKVKTLNIRFREYIDQNGRFFGSYPYIKEMEDLSNEIYSDVNSAINDLDLNDNDDIISPVIKSKIDQDDNFVKIDISVEFEDNKTSFVYYVDKELMQEISQIEYDKKQKEIDEKKSEEEKNQTEAELNEIVMVPLRVNAESLGWNVEWRKKTDSAPARAILTKGQTKIAVFYNSTLAYDLVITKDISVNDITTGNLERSAELIDDGILYVPSSFVEKYLKSEETTDGTKNTTSDKKDSTANIENKN